MSRRPKYPNETDPLVDLAKNVPPAPYQNQNEEWNAINRILVLESEREMRAWKPIPETEIFRHTGIKRQDIIRTSLKPQFIDFCRARAKNRIEREMTDIAPYVARLLKDVAKNASDGEADGKMKALKQLSETLKDFGLKDWDGYRVDVEDDVDVEKIVKECVDFINTLPGWAHPEVPPQRFLKKLLEPGKEEREPTPKN